jgi:hypothetical protein
MKKVALVIVAAFVIALAFTSCKSQQKCPAYGEARYHRVEQM